ncbi:hypothetical protein [Bacteroides fragilis]|jgi:hypothetical protein
MGFTTSCFIRKNTEELRKKLEDIGYKNACSSNHHDIIYTDAEHGVYFTTFASNITDDEVSYDCKYNRTLFLAIAALRDDTDNNQWFVMDVEIYVDLTKGTWFQATDRDGGKHVGTQIEALYCHKATVEELINHFK